MKDMGGEVACYALSLEVEESDSMAALRSSRSWAMARSQLFIIGRITTDMILANRDSGLASKVIFTSVPFPFGVIRNSV